MLPEPIRVRDMLGFNYMPDAPESFRCVTRGRCTGKRGWANGAVKMRIAEWLSRGYRVGARMCHVDTGKRGAPTELTEKNFESFVDNYGGWVTIAFSYGTDDPCKA